MGLSFAKVLKLPGMGYWSSESPSSGDRDEIFACVGPLSDADLAALFLYMGCSTREVAYMGDAYCRLCPNKHEDGRRTGWWLGSHDMVTPDSRWRFPEGWEHYITVHGVAPDPEFVASAVAWRAGR